MAVREYFLLRLLDAYNNSINPLKHAELLYASELQIDNLLAHYAYPMVPYSSIILKAVVDPDFVEEVIEEPAIEQPPPVYQE
eukprot:1196020-Prorocentrum_minimum.AAC.9